MKTFYRSAALLLFLAASNKDTVFVRGDGNEDASGSVRGRSLLVAGVPCLNSFSATIKNERCDFETIYASIEAKISNRNRCAGRSVVEEFLTFVPGYDYTGLDATDIPAMESIITTACQAAIDSVKEKGLDFLSIMKNNEVQVKAYFDGETEWNTARETSTDIFGTTVDVFNHYPKPQVNKIQGAFADESIFKWPGLEDGLIQEPYKYGVSNFEECQFDAAMCCWTSDRQANDDNGDCAKPYDEQCVDADPADNTDLCYVDMARAPDSSRVAGGYAVFPGDTEGPIHCHGFAWSNNDPQHASAMFKANNLFYVSMYDHMSQRGYVRSVPGAPMCGCVEKMPVVSRSDCTEIEPTNVRFLYTLDTTGFTVELTRTNIAFNACIGTNGNNNDLDGYFDKLVQGGYQTIANQKGLRETLVGDNCTAKIDEILSLV